MKPYSAEEIYRAKERRRKELADLPVDEKVRRMEELHEFGIAMIEARKTLPPSARVQEDPPTRASD